MPNKYVLISIAVLICAAFAFGRYSAPEKVRVETKIEKQIEVQQIVHTVTKIVKEKDGTEETTITQDTDTDTHTDLKKDTVSVTSKGSQLNISILAGVEPHLFQGASLGPIVYGASVTKEILGPITIGAWALSDKTVGASIGLNF